MPLIGQYGLSLDQAYAPESWPTRLYTIFWNTNAVSGHKSEIDWHPIWRTGKFAIICRGFMLKNSEECLYKRLQIFALLLASTLMEICFAILQHGLMWTYIFRSSLLDHFVIRRCEISDKCSRHVREVLVFGYWNSAYVQWYRWITLFINTQFDFMSLLSCLLDLFMITWTTV